jgi:single-strand DNA-binding protein
MATAASQSKDTSAATGDRNIERRGSVAKSGNLSSDPELHYKDDKAWCRFRLATERPKQAGDRSDRETEFYQVVCFDSLAEHVAQSLTKGMRALVIGRGEIQRWVGDDGQPRTSRTILADHCGPDLRWATAVVQKAKSGKASEPGEFAVQEEEPF